MGKVPKKQNNVQATTEASAEQSATTSEERTATSENQQPQINIERVYIKDISFESPEGPQSFGLQETPEISVEINTKSRKVGDNAYEVVVSLTVTSKHEDKTLYIAEIQQAGLFLVINVPEESLGQALGTFCPNILFPYARETIDSVINKATFPSLMLAHINFDVLYAQNLDRQNQEAKKADQGGEGQ